MVHVADWNILTKCGLRFHIAQVALTGDLSCLYNCCEDEPGLESAFAPATPCCFEMSASHDIRAQAVAQAVYEAVQPELVILFGSRARGDYRPDSDIDLLILTAEPDRDIGAASLKVAFQAMREVFAPEVNVEVLSMTFRTFHNARVAPNHVAGQACRDGVTMNGEPPPFPAVSEPDDWPDIEQRFTVAWRNLRTVAILVAAEGPQESIGFHAHQAVENALKGWISALGSRYRNQHAIDELIAIIRRHSSEDNMRAGESLVWLTDYAVKFRYEGANEEMEDPTGLLEEVSDLCCSIRERVVTLTGRQDVPKPLRGQ